MTQPTSVDMTFDTSLVDLSPDNSQHQNAYPSNPHGSFSTTESAPSDNGQAETAPSCSVMKTPTIQSTSPNLERTPKPNHQEPTTSPPPKVSTSVQHLPTQSTYNEWASVYDTDGNILQSIDDIELSTLLPTFLSLSLSASPSAFNILDLGCGTGRNTSKLLSYPWPQNLAISITGLDFSSSMLALASQKVSSLSRIPNVTFQLFETDCFPTVTSSSASPVPVLDSQPLQLQNAIISTLVLEHVPLAPFFDTLAALLVPGGSALITNMHHEMGAISQAGFVREDGTKVRGSSFAHSVQETVQAAEKVGFEVLEVRERGIQRGDVEGGIVGQRGWKWVGARVWFGVVVRKGV